MKSTSLFLSLDALFSFARRAFFFLLEKERKLPFLPKFKQGEIKLPHIFVIFRKNSLIFL